MMAMREDVLYEVLLDLQKSYGALSREHFIEILVSYGVGPHMECLLRNYCDHLTMVAWEGLYYVDPLKTT